MLGWLVFRCENVGQFGEFFVALFDLRHIGFANDSHAVTQPLFAVFTVLGFLLVFRGIDSFELADRKSLAVVLSQFALFFLAVGELLSQGFNPFLYFQF